VAGQDAELALGGPGDDHLGLTGPDLLLDGDDLDVQLLGHAVSPYEVSSVFRRGSVGRACGTDSGEV
jgi:hypothetical protein